MAYDIHGSAFNRVRESFYGVITECVSNEMLEGRRKSHARCQRDTIIEVPELAEQ